MRKRIKWYSLVICLALVVSLLSPVPTAEAAGIQVEQFTYYGRDALSQMEKGETYVWAYDRIMTGIDEMAERVELRDDTYKITTSELKMIYDAYYNDHGGLFWVQNGYNYSYSGSTVYAIVPSYTMTGDVLAQARAEFDAKVDQILSGITEDMTEFEKELYIYRYLADRNNYVSGTTNQHNAYGALVEGSSVCDGYAKAFQYLLTCVGIQSHRVSGFGNGGRHAWNYVRINGKYYQADPTWDDSQWGVRYDYFNITDEQMGRDHQITYPGYPLPVCNSEDANYYNMTGRIFDPETYSVAEFIKILRENNLRFDGWYDGDVWDLINWAFDHMDQICEKLNIVGSPSISYSGGYGGVMLELSGLDAAVIQDGEIYYYTWINEAIQACKAGSVLQLQQDVFNSLELDKPLFLDLNGYEIGGNVTGSGDTYLFDSQTDDFYVRDTAGYGMVNGTVSGVEPLEGYLVIEEEKGTSYHCVEISLEKVNLKANSTGIYYTGAFRYDSVVAQYLAATGVTLSTENATPVADDSDPTSRYTTSTNSVLVKNILTDGAADNASRAKTLIYARAYLKMADGTILYSDAVVTNLKTLVEAVDATAWAKLTDAQRNTLKTMYTTFADIMGSWKISNLKSA